MFVKGAIVTSEHSVLYWRNWTFTLSVEEAHAIALEIHRHIGQAGVRALLVDNRGVRGGWPPDVAFVWNDLMKDVMTTVERCATIASAPMVTQMNRHSKSQGTLKRIQAFYTVESALYFIRAPNFSRLDRYLYPI